VLDQCDGMVVCAAPKNADNYSDVYVDTANAVKDLLKQRTTPFQLVYTSSTSVYQGHKTTTVFEDAIITPANEKTNILYETEKVYLSCNSSFIKTCILRFGGIYGPGRDLINRAKKYFSGRNLTEDGKEPTNHIHLDDCVRSIEFAFENHLQGIYNIVNFDHPIRKDLYDGLCNSLNVPLPIWNSMKESQHGCKCIVSNKKICDTGFSFSHPHLNIPAFGSCAKN